MKTLDAISVVFQLNGDLSKIVLPSEAGGQRLDRLWETTCFEAFIRSSGNDRYREFNVAPNGDWAAYQFEEYRSDPIDLLCSAPSIDVVWNDRAATIQVDLKLPESTDDNQLLLLGPAVILEDVDGVRSFWAIHHALSKPDFHQFDTCKIALD